MITQITPSKDAYTFGYSPDSNYGSDSDLHICRSSERRKNTFIGFNIADAPPAANVSTVTIYLLNTFASRDVTFYLQRVIEPWVESEITYNTEPEVTTTNQTSGTTTDANDPLWEQFDVTQIYKDAKNAGDDFSIRMYPYSSGGPSNDPAWWKSRETSNSPYIQIEYEEAPTVSPTISNIIWSPKDDFVAVTSGASLLGNGTELFVLAIGGTPSTATLRIDNGAQFTVVDGDTFQFNGTEWTVHHIIDDWECKQIVMSAAIDHPRLGEAIDFAATIDWHGTEARSVKWYYFKAPKNPYAKTDVSWTLFATGDIAEHTFTDAGDTDITHIKVVAQNMAGEYGDFGNGSCQDGVFVLVAQHGFTIEVTNATGEDDLAVYEIAQIADRNAYMALSQVARWDNVTNGTYELTMPSAGNCFSSPTVDFCSPVTKLRPGRKYAIARSTMPLTGFLGEDVHTLGTGLTQASVSKSYNSWLETTICGLFGLTGSECTAFIAELNDLVFVANYASIRATGTDMFGNTRELTWFDHAALPFAIAGSLIPVPAGQIMSKGLGAASKLTDKIFSMAVNDAVITAMLKTPDRLLGYTKESIPFSTAIVQVGKENAEEVIALLDADDVAGALSKLQDHLNALDIEDAHLPDYWSWEEFNTLMKEKIANPTTWAEFVKGMKCYIPQARAAEKAAAKAAHTADDARIINAATQNPDVIKEVGKNVKKTLQSIDSVTDTAVKNQKVKATEQIAKKMPAAFDDISKASIYDISGYLIKHDTVINVLGDPHCSANYEMVNRLFKRLFDGVDEAALAATECNGVVNIAKEDPIAISKAVDDYTSKVDKERLMLSLGKSGFPGAEAAAWIASVKKNIDVDDVFRRFGTDVHDVVNDASQASLCDPGGIYREIGEDAIAEAINGVPSFTHVRNLNNYIAGIATTVKNQCVTGHLTTITQKAIAEDTRSVAQVFIDAGVDNITSYTLSGVIDDIYRMIDATGNTLTETDVSTITARIVEENVVAGSNTLEKALMRVVKEGSITNDELKALNDVANHSPLEWAMTVENVPADVVASFNNILESTSKGRTFKVMTDLYDKFKTKIDGECGSSVGDAISKFYSLTAPVGLRVNRGAGGAGFFNSFSKYGMLKGILGDHPVRNFLIYSFTTTVASLVVFWYAFEWGPWRYLLQKAGKLPASIGDRVSDAKNDATFGRNDFENDPSDAFEQERMIINVGKLCELVDYANKNPMTNSDLDSVLDDIRMYFGTTSGLTTETLRESLVDALVENTKSYNAHILKCIADGTCTGTPVCITGEMVFAERALKLEALGSGAAYQTILDAAWQCTPELPETGSIICMVTSSMGYGAKVTDTYGTELGTIDSVDGFLVSGLALNVDHVLKIVKTGNYTDCAETFTLTEADPEQAFTCDMNCTDWVDSVTIAMNPSSDVVPGDTVAFTGTAVSAKDITGWLWNFGDEHCPNADNTSTLQNPSHRYEKTGVFQVTVTATNECGNTGTGDAEVWVGTDTPVPPPPEEDELGTLLVKQPISTTGSAIRGWDAEVFVGIKKIGNPQLTIQFGTDEYVSDYGGPCGTHTIKLVLDGYQDVSMPWTINDGNSKTWQPEMIPVGYVPPVNKFAIDFYIPENASLTSTKITSVSRLATGIRRMRR